jgi:hypothetical protein
MTKPALLEISWHAVRQCVVGGVLVLSSSLADANVIWPPAVYYSTLAVWWVIAGGLVAEFVLHLLVLRMPFLPLARVVVLSNLASTAIGLVLTWPLVFWEVGVTRLAAMAPLSIFATLFVIFLVNIGVEYVVAVRWLRVKRSNTAIASFLLANTVSYGLVVWVALSGVLSGT